MAWSIAVWVRPGGVVGWMVGSARSFPVGAWPTSARAPAAIRTRAVTSAASRMTTRRSCAAPFGTLTGAAGSTIGASGSANSSRRSRVSVPSPTPFWRYPSAPAGTPGPPALPDVPIRDIVVQDHGVGLLGPKRGEQFLPVVRLGHDGESVVFEEPPDQ